MTHSHAFQRKKRVGWVSFLNPCAFDSGVIDRIAVTAETGTPLGNDRFRERIEAVLNRKVGYAKRGRQSRRAI